MLTPLRISVLSAIVIVALMAFAYQTELDSPVQNDSFQRGEVLEFKMSYSIFTVGKGYAKIHPEYHKMNERDCYKVDVFGKTVGVVDWVADVDDHWGAYVDTVSLLPHQFYRRIREGNYKRDEWTNFEHDKKRIEVRVLDNKTGKMKDPKFYEAPSPTRDMVAGFLYLRAMDLTHTLPGDTVDIKGFFEDTFYTLRVLYKGKDVVKTKAGKFRALKFVPVMPDNKVFDGENSVTAWFSDDKNRIPIKISADMFIGSAGVELISYRGLRNKANVIK